VRTGTSATAPWARVAYGLDVSGSGVTMVRAERARGGLSWEHVPFVRDDLEAAVVKGAAVVSSVPVGTAIATWVVAPFSSASKAKRVFPTLLDIQLPFPLESCVSLFTETLRIEPDEVELPAAMPGPAGGTSRQRTASLALAARTEDIERRLAELSSMGIEPHVLDHQGVALWTQGLREFPSNAVDAPVRVVVLGRGDSTIMVIGRGARFWSAHRVRASEPAALDRYLLAQVQKRGLDTQSVSVEWLWAGDVATVSELRAAVEQRWFGRSVSVDAPESFLARALATRALLAGPTRGNLRSGALAHAGARARTHGAESRAAATLLAAGLLLCVAPFGLKQVAAARRSAVDAQFGTRLNKLLGYAEKARGANALLIVERELADRAVRQQPLSDAMKASLLAELQGSIAGIGDKAQIGYLALRSGELKLEGTIPGRGHESSLRNALSELGYEVDIALGESGDAIAFDLTAVRGGDDE
jgi:hypothetical protein